MSDMDLARGTGTSVVVDKCQTCGDEDLHSILFLGYLPPVNTMPKIGARPVEQPGYPAELLWCQKCQLVQLGLVVDPHVLFPREYPYTSSTTKILRENFAELYEECSSLIDLSPHDLIVDIGSNDGNLLSNFQEKHRVQGVTPEDIGQIARDRGIPTVQAYFGRDIAQRIVDESGKAKIVTATNVFAHIEDIHEIVSSIVELLDDDGVFISESHYLVPFVETLQYDTIYHEHLRYYSLHSLQALLESHGLEVFHAKEIPTHGGSIRVYAAREGRRQADETVVPLLEHEKNTVQTKEQFAEFKRQVVLSKLELQALLLNIKKQGDQIYGIGAPSRASTLINYVGIDDGLVDCVVEVNGSYKIGKYIPGTTIQVLDESILFEEQPQYALLLSWHIADELAPKIKSLGFKGDFIVPLPRPLIVRNADI